MLFCYACVVEIRETIKKVDFKVQLKNQFSHLYNKSRWFRFII